jgi:hypothetical protein
MTPSKVHKSSITGSKDIEVVEMSGKKFKSLVLKVINELKEDAMNR